MDITGERFLPEVPGDWTAEHMHRYALAAGLCAGKRVLDAACGEGYGSALLASTAESVVGVDISAEAVAFAAGKYTAGNLEYRRGSVTDLSGAGLGDHEFDVVVSFETIEHLTEQDAMLQELRRVLKPEGLLIISSPDKREYSDIPSYHNEYHVQELYRDEFEALLGTYFSNMRLHLQRMEWGSLVVGEGPAGFISLEPREEGVERTEHLSHAVYLLALASNRPIVESLPHSIWKMPFADSDLVKYLKRKHEIAEILLEGANTHIGKLEDVVRKLEQALLHKDEMLRAAGQELQAMCDSKSWKLTAPLRRMGGCFRTLLNR